MSFTFLAFIAKFIVDIVYAIDYYFDDNVAMSIVFELPPSESRNIFVRTESRYGICVALLDNFYITMLNDVRDLFILDAYFNLSPAVWVDFCF